MLRSEWDSQIPASGPGMLPFFTSSPRVAMGGVWARDYPTAIIQYSELGVANRYARTTAHARVRHGSGVRRHMRTLNLSKLLEDGGIVWVRHERNKSNPNSLLLNFGGSYLKTMPTLILTVSVVIHEVTRCLHTNFTTPTRKGELS